MLTEANGIPLVVQVEAANTHDVNTLLPLVVNLPKVKGKPGRPKWKPAALYADKGFDDQALRDILAWLGIQPHIPRRGEMHRETNEQGLGKIRWVVERTIAWFHQFRRLFIRWERNDQYHQSLLQLASTCICHRILVA